MPQNNPDIALWCIVGAVVLFLLIVLFFGLVSFIPKFSHELKSLNIEIGRTDGIEREYWKREKRRLLLSLLPFIKYK